MSLKNKDIVENFYKSNFYQDEKIFQKYVHPDVELTWYGTTGSKKLNYKELVDINEEAAKSYDSLYAQIDKIIAGDDNVAIKLTYYVTTIENPNEEMLLGHFMTIWEFKEGKLYKGIQISQLGEDLDYNPWN